MRVFYTILFATIVSICVFSCSKTKVTPSNSSHADTSTTLIPSVALVGNWNILTDTIAYPGESSYIMYHGVATDHYIFTRYGNLFINEGLDSYIDTAIYSYNSINYSTNWENLASSIKGTYSRVQSSSPAYAITSLDADTLILTSNVQTANGLRYEQIVFRKQQ